MSTLQSEYPRFSDIVDDFTHYNCTRMELWFVFKFELGPEHADGKMARADENPDRFEAELKTIEFIHGKELADKRREEMSKPPLEDSSTPAETH